MKSSLTTVGLVVWAVIVTLSIASATSAFARQNPMVSGPQKTLEQARPQPEQRQLIKDKAAYVAGIVQRWENQAKASGRGDSNSVTNLTGELMKLRPESLLLAGQASSFEELMEIIAVGQPLDTIVKASPSLWQQGQMIPPVTRTLSADVSPSALGDAADDLVFTPVTPCRIVDSRVAMGPLSAMVPRTYDVDGSDFSAQGGVAASCGIPQGVARAVAMTITVVGPSGPGWLAAWQVGSPWPGNSFVTYVTGDVIADTAIVPVVSGPGADFTVLSYASTQIVIDVSGYFAAPAATPLDCTYVQLQGIGTGNVANDTMFDFPSAAPCTAGYTPISISCQYTGNSPEGLALTQVGPPVIGPFACVWRNETGGALDASRFVTYTQCCRIPGR